MPQTRTQDLQKQIHRSTSRLRALAIYIYIIHTHTHLYTHLYTNTCIHISCIYIPRGIMCVCVCIYENTVTARQDGYDLYQKHFCFCIYFLYLFFCLSFFPSHASIHTLPTASTTFDLFCLTFTFCLYSFIILVFSLPSGIFDDLVGCRGCQGCRALRGTISSDRAVTSAASSTPQLAYFF